MLSELCIENLAVIKQAVIPFTNEFNVFTGETGAGKSILINGINAVLGTVVGGIFDAGIAQQGHSRHFLWCTTHSVFSVNSVFLLASLGTLGSLKSCKITHFPRYGGRHGGAAVRMTAYLPDACSIRQGPAIGREYRVRQYGLRA